MQIYGKLPVLGVKIWFGEFKGREYTRQPCYCEANGLVWGGQEAEGGNREEQGLQRHRLQPDSAALRGIRPCAAPPGPQPHRSRLVRPSPAGRRAPGPGEARLWAGKTFLTAGHSG